MRHYLRLAGMIATITLALFVLQYLDVLRASHLRYSETHSYLALAMGSVIALVVLAYLLPLLPYRRVNAGILAAALAVFVVALWLLRSQATVGDVSYLKSMLPQQSAALLASQRARLSDPRVQAFAKRAAEARREEIEQMRTLLRELEAAP